MLAGIFLLSYGRVRNRFYQLIGKTDYWQLIGGYFPVSHKTNYFEINQNEIDGTGKEWSLILGC